MCIAQVGQCLKCPCWSYKSCKVLAATACAPVCRVRRWHVTHRHATLHRVCHAPSALSTLCSSELPPPASSCECGVHNSAAALSCASLAAGDATAAKSAEVCCWSAMFLSRQGQAFTQVKPAHTSCLSKRSVHADGRRVLSHARSACDVACVRENFPAGTMTMCNFLGTRSKSHD